MSLVLTIAGSVYLGTLTYLRSSSRNVYKNKQTNKVVSTCPLSKTVQHDFVKLTYRYKFLYFELRASVICVFNFTLCPDYISGFRILQILWILF